MEFIIITGMSGAGKGQALKYLEDDGYFCIDNIPPILMPKFASLCAEGGWVEKAAMVIDVRGKNFFEQFHPSIDELSEQKHTYKIIFMEANDEVLVKRFKENRRVHPLALQGRITGALEEERNLLQPIKEMADYVIDTSATTLQQLREEIMSVTNSKKKSSSLSIMILSFGYKYGNPIDCDLMFDVRFIPNPFYIGKLRHLSGQDNQVKDFVLASKETQIFIEKYMDMMDFLIPNYIREGKSQIVIGIGCTGGRHRSVAIAERIYEIYSEKNQKVSIEHRDIFKDGKGYKVSRDVSGEEGV